MDPDRRLTGTGRSPSSAHRRARASSLMLASAGTIALAAMISGVQAASASAVAPGRSLAAPSAPEEGGGAGAAEQAHDVRDPRAVAAADAVEAAMTPGGNWGTVEGLKFTFAVVKEGKRLASFDHVWNPRTGQYRVEGLGPDKKRTVVLFDTATRKGRAWTSEPASSESAAGAAPEGSAPAAAAQDPGGVQADRLVEAQGEGAGKLLEWGYGRFINDSYWLLMPLKMKDPGVNLAFEGEKTPEGGEPCDVLRLTFNGVGLTPGDSYWVFVNKKTHLVDRWEFVLEGQEEKDRGEWLWKDWRTFGPLRLAASHPRADGKISIDFPSVAVGALPANAFDAPR